MFLSPHQPLSPLLPSWEETIFRLLWPPLSLVLMPALTFRKRQGYPLHDGRAVEGHCTPAHVGNQTKANSALWVICVSSLGTQVACVPPVPAGAKSRRVRQ